MSVDISVIPPLAERLTFIREIKLLTPAPKTRSRVLSVKSYSALGSSGSQSAVLLGDTLLNYMEGMSRDERREIRNSVRLAQILSNKYKDEKLDLAAWLDIYAKALNYMGWYSDRKPGEKKYDDFSGDISSKMVDVVRELGNEPMLDNTLAAFAALKKHKAGLASYAKESLWGQSFQTMPSGRDEQGRITLVLNHSRLNATRQVENFLFCHWRSGEVLLRHNYLSFFLDRSAYAQVRAEVEAVIEEDDMREIELRLESIGT